MGFFCVDNLPTTLIPTFADLVARSSRDHPIASRSAWTCARASTSRTCSTRSGELRERGHAVEVLFLEASEESLVRRYHETRRRHPLAPATATCSTASAPSARRSPTSARSPTASSTPPRLTVHQLKDRLDRASTSRRGPAAGPDGLAGLVRLQARRPLRRRSRLRRPLPAQPALRGGTAPARRARRAGCGTSS